MLYRWRCVKRLNTQLKRLTINKCFQGLIIFKALVSYTGTVYLFQNCEIDPKYAKKQIINMFHVYNRYNGYVSKFSHTHHTYVCPSIERGYVTKYITRAP